MQITNYNLFRSDLYEHGIEYAAEHSVRLGFDSVELLHDMTSRKPNLLDVVTPAETRRVLEANGLNVTCYSVAAQLYTEDPKAVEDALCRHAELAAELGSPYFHHTLILTKPADDPTYDAVFDGIVASAQRVARHCQALGLIPLYEPQGRYFNGIEGLGRYYHKMKSSGFQVGICGDLGNSLFADVSPTDFTKVFASEIKHVHIKDYLRSDEPFPDRKCARSLGGKWLAETEIGSGIVDHRTCLELLREVNYNGALSFEIRMDDDGMKRAIAYIKSIIS